MRKTKQAGEDVGLILHCSKAQVSEFARRFPLLVGETSLLQPACSVPKPWSRFLHRGKILVYSPAKQAFLGFTFGRLPA